ncbi:MAG: family 16 glycoside hydrolase [Gemmatimonadales bacterium]
MPRLLRLLPLLLAAPILLAAQGTPAWRVHEMTRPLPATISPAIATAPVAPPPGAVVLFDGTNLKHWVGSDGKPARWTLGKGYFEVRPGAGTLTTVDSFGDMQLHLEWAEPVPARGKGQDRGNSGVFLMGRYELQILDSWHNETYTDGQAGSMYGQHPPMFNVARPAGAWQSYDVFFRRPRFDASGALLSPARVTVLQNGVPVQNNVELFGPTSWLSRLPYEAHPDRMPLGLQDHSFKVRFRNIWVRPLPEGNPPPPPHENFPVADGVLEAFVGSYDEGGNAASVLHRDGRLWLDVGDGPMPLVADASDVFSIEGVDATARFTRDATGEVHTLGFIVGGETRRYEKQAEATHQVGRIRTRLGEILFVLSDQTPHHKESFLRLAAAHYWDSLTFNRVIKGFVTQGGCPDTPQGFSDSPYLLAPEFNDSLKHVYGAVGAGRDDNPGQLSAGCQFYIVVNQHGIPRLDGHYTVYGQVFKGMDVVEAIASVPKDSTDNPLHPVGLHIDVITMSTEELRRYGGQ